MCVCCVCMCLKQNQCLLQSNKQNSRFERAIENGFGVVLVVCKQFKLLIVGRTTHTHTHSHKIHHVYIICEWRTECYAFIDGWAIWRWDSEHPLNIWIAIAVTSIKGLT